MTLRVRPLLAGLAVAALLAGCAPSSPPDASATRTVAPTHTPKPRPTPTPTPTPTTTVSPLRGTTVDIAEVTGPALAAKIDNVGDARPQWGLDRTDLVFEELVEGGLTRYVAVWFSDVPKEIGPVRSIRPMDPDIVSPLGGIIAYSGGQQRFVDMMRATDVHNAIHGYAPDDRFMFRSPEKPAPHNVVVQARSLRAAYEDLAPPTQQFSYSLRGGAPVFGTAASRIDVTFSAGSARSWQWDADSGTYLRRQDGAVDTDATGTQLSAVNVVALEVAIDWSYGIVPRTILVDSGKAWISTGGHTLLGHWSKSSRRAPIELSFGKDVVATLAPGNTWVELVPSSGDVVVTP